MNKNKGNKKGKIANDFREVKIHKYKQESL